MDTEVTTALIGGGITIAAALLTGYWAPGLKANRDRRLEARDSEARYREAILGAAYDCQSRFWNIAHGEFLATYYQGRDPTDPDRAYAETNTLWLLAQYFCWIEILRRDTGYYALGSQKRGQDLLRLLDATRQAFASDSHHGPFQVFWGVQRAMGELSITERGSESSRRSDCLGYAEFLKRLTEPEFGRWFESLRGDISRTSEMLDPELLDRKEIPERVVAIQHALIDLVDFLDPKQARIPAEAGRSKIAPERR
jgi:hypothetical protein